MQGKVYWYIQTPPAETVDRCNVFILYDDPAYEARLVHNLRIVAGFTIFRVLFYDEGLSDAQTMAIQN